MSRRLLDGLLAASLLTMTWAKIHWQAGSLDLTIGNITASAFVAAFVIDRLQRRDDALPRPAITLCGFMLTFLAVYLAGYFDLDSNAALTFWIKGIVSWAVHFLLLIMAVAYVIERGAAVYLRAIRWFVAGITLNAVYGVVQLALVVAAGVNLDKLVVGPLTAGQGKVGGINVFGQVARTENIYRINALTGDPNHLGVMLCVPLLLLLPVWLSATRGRRRLGALLVFLFVVQVLTLSRSGALGDVVGLLVLSPLLAKRLPSARSLVLVLAPLVAGAVALYVSSPFVRTVIRARTDVGGRGTNTHFEFYRLVSPALDPHPLFGMGFNTFAVFYEFLTGQSNYGPHSFWVATLVETGIVGLTVYLVYGAWLVACALLMARSEQARARVLGYGWLAAMAGTAAANLFYLTMQFDYFYGVVMLVAAGQYILAPGRARLATTAAQPRPALH